MTRRVPRFTATGPVTVHRRQNVERTLGGGEVTIGERSAHTVLYIEDDAANLRLVERLFSRRPDLDLISATRGLLGIEMACDHRPAVALLDIDLPDIKGDVVLKCLRGNPLTNTIPVVMISGDSNDRQIQRFLETGAVAYLTKPIDALRLLATVDELIQEQNPRVDD